MAGSCTQTTSVARNVMQSDEKLDRRLDSRVSRRALHATASVSAPVDRRATCDGD